MARVPRETVVRFHPAGGGDWVNADAFADAMRKILDGLRSVANAVAPSLAQRRSWSKALAKESLILAVGPASRGSLQLAVRVGGGETPPLDGAWVGDVGLAAMSKAIRAASKNEVSIAEVSTNAARLLSEGVRAVREVNVSVEIRTRRLVQSSRRKGKWKTLLDLTAVEPGLARHVERREAAELSVVQLVGQIVGLVYDPPSMTLVTGRGKVNLTMPAKLRARAREHWGKDVIVMAEACVNAEGEMRDAKAVEISGTRGIGDEDEELLASLREKWATPETAAYIESLRGDG